MKFFKKEPAAVNQISQEVSYLTLFLTRLDKRLTHQTLREIADKHGTVTGCSLRMGQDKFGNTISLGKATVTYASKEEAAKAQQSLYFEDRLGKLINIDFYKPKQVLMQEHKGSVELEMLAKHYLKTQNNQGFGGSHQYQNRGF